MGYTTEFEGSVTISPPLNAKEVEYLQRFNSTRRMDRAEGPYFAEPGPDGFGQHKTPGIRDYNSPPDGQPGLWCGWTVSDDGTRIEWDGGEKFSDSAGWMTYIIDHFLRPRAIAQSNLPFLQANHTCNGIINAEGEDREDTWHLIVRDNQVTTERGLAQLPAGVAPAIPTPAFTQTLSDPLLDALSIF